MMYVKYEKHFICVAFMKKMTTTPMTFVVCSDLISKNVNCSSLLLRKEYEEIAYYKRNAVLTELAYYSGVKRFQKNRSSI